MEWRPRGKGEIGMKRSSTDYVLYFLLVFLSVFIDSYFSRWFNYFGRPVLSVFLPIGVIVAFFIGIRPIVDRTAKMFLRLLILIIVVNIIADAVFIFKTGEYKIYSDYVIIKSFNSIVMILYIPVYYILLYTLMKKQPKRKAAMPFIVTFYFLLLVLAVELVTMPKAWPIFHFHNSWLDETSSRYYTRVRLTTTEASLTVPLIITYGTITLWYYITEHNKRMTVVSVLALLCFLITSTARSFIIFFLIAIGVLFLSYLLQLFKGKTKKARITAIVILASLPIVAVLGFLVVYSEIFKKSLGSLATRSTSQIAVFIHTIKYPFGMGNSVSVLTLQDILRKVVDWFSNSSIGASWNYWEVNMLIDDPERISSYGITTFGVYCGIVGLAMMYFEFIKIFTRYLKSKNYNPLINAVYWGFLGIMTLTIPLPNCFSFLAFLVFINILSGSDPSEEPHLSEQLMEAGS